MNLIEDAALVYKTRSVVKKTNIILIAFCKVFIYKGLCCNIDLLFYDSPAPYLYVLATANVSLSNSLSPKYLLLSL